MISNRVRFISFVLIAYMVAALAWWTLLLYNKNEEVYTYQQAIIQQEVIDDLPDLATIQAKYDRQKIMILGEGFVFAILLIIGILIINRAAKREFQIASMKNNFLLSVTHELKSPLASIKMILETLLNKPKLDTDRRTSISANALKETNRLESMINKLLLSTKIEDHYQYNYEEVEIKDFFLNVISRYRYQGESHRIQLDCQDGIIAELDKEAIQSVITNLVENAIKYSEKDDNITIRVERKNNELIIDCIDQGSGIPDTEKKEVLNKFYRIGNEEFRTSEGSGLGLFIVNKIVDSHKGRFEILDNQPKGTIMRIQLPIHQQTPIA